VQAAANAATAGFHTFVLGVSTTGSVATTVLNQLADAGMEPRMDFNPLAPRYYPANNGSELVSALATITDSLTSCSFSFAAAPQTTITLRVGGAVAPQDTTHAEGWDYTADHLAVVLYGSFCDAVRTSGASVKASFPCGVR